MKTAVDLLLLLEWAGEECCHLCPGSTEYATYTHKEGCELDALLTRAGYPTQESRDAARERLKGGIIMWNGMPMREGKCPPGETCLSCDRLGSHLEPAGKDHVWSEPVRYAGSIADGPPPGVNHRQAVVYECTACHVIRVEAMTDEQGKTMTDAFNPPKRSIDDFTKTWDGKSPCLS